MPLKPEFWMHCLLEDRHWPQRLRKKTGESGGFWPFPILDLTRQELPVHAQSSGRDLHWRGATFLIAQMGSPDIETVSVTGWKPLS
jgi:hypothetical protein